MKLFLKALTILLFSSFFILISAQAQKPASGGSKPGNGKPGANGGGQPIGVITGALHDQNTKEHVEYGNVLLYRVKDSTMITGTITDSKGRFTFTTLTPGRYYLKISFIGYEDKLVQDIAITQQIINIKLPDIFINPKLSTLNAVEIKAEKSLITNNLDKKVITVDKNMALSGGSAVDIMENVPSVAVDAEGNVSLRGNQNITLLIDGKPASQAGISSSDILNQLPASAIESIEVITNPSVRYDPDGTSGIINIVLKKKALQGFNGQISGTAGSNDKYNGSLNLNYRHNKFNAFGTIDARYNHNLSNSESTRTSYAGEISNVLKQSNTGSRDHNSLNFNAGVDYFIDTRNNITLSVQRRNMDFLQDGLLESKNYLSNDLLTRYFDRDSESARKIRSNSITGSYKHTFAQKGREFTTDIIVNDNRMNNNQWNMQTDYDLNTLLPLDSNQKQHNIASNNNTFYTIQGNYIHPFASGARLEAGYKATMRDLAMKYDYKNFNYESNEYESQPLLKNNYDYKEQIFAVYGIYSNSWKKFKYQAGLRFEQVLSNSKVEQTVLDFSNNYPSFYPSFHTQYDLGKGRELQLSYSRRVNRPSPREMNPYVDYSDSLNIRKGNPELRPEYTNSLELGFLKYWDKSSFTATLFYRSTTDEVEDIRILDVTTGVSTSMPQNINKSNSSGVELVSTVNPYQWLRLMGTLSAYRAVVSDVPEYNIPGVDKLAWSARLNSTFNYSKSGSFQLIANYMSPTNTVQVKNDGNFGVDASIRHDFFKNKLTLTARVTDIFNTRTFNSTITGTNYVTVSNRYMDSRVFYAGFQLRINNYSKKSEKERAEGQDMDF